MDIFAVREGWVVQRSTEQIAPLIPLGENLKFGINLPTKLREKHFSGGKIKKVEVCGVEFVVELPWWGAMLEDTESRSTSHAKYIMKGNLPLGDGINLGILLQLLEAGRETSCHSHPAIQELGHPGTRECFFPMTLSGEDTPLLYTPDSPKGIHIPPRGARVEIGVPHQLQAPEHTHTITVICMYHIPEALWMKGHIPCKNPFVPYTK